MITGDQRTALKALRQVNSALHADNVWAPAPYHVAGLHRDVEQSVLSGISTAKKGMAESPLGIVIQGQKGAGKTHLLGWVRRQVQEADGYFFLVGLMQGIEFWDSTALAVVQGLTRIHARGATQLAVFLRRLACPSRSPRRCRGRPPCRRRT
jgi:hypothetical protein